MKKFLAALLFLLSASFAFAQSSPVDPSIPKILYRIPGQENARVERDVVYKKAGNVELKMDVYSPAVKSSSPLPVVLFISGASETKHWNVYKDYGELTAANGMIAVQFDKRYPREGGEASALEDIRDLIAFLRENAAKFNIDKDRIGLWAFSGGGGLISAGMQENQPFIRVLVSYYGIGFDTPRRRVAALGERLPPILVVRAGRDIPVLNNAIELFVMDAMSRNARIDFYNYPTGQHAFELRDDAEQTREILRRTFGFIRDQFGLK